MCGPFRPLEFNGAPGIHTGGGLAGSRLFMAYYVGRAVIAGEPIVGDLDRPGN